MSTAEVAGQRVFYQRIGDVTIGAHGATPGDSVYLADTDGELTVDYADVTAGRNISVLGVIKDATSIQLALAATGETK